MSHSRNFPMVKKASTTGFAAARLKPLKSAVECDIEDGKYHGAVILVARHGKIGLHEAIGYARFSDRQPMRKDKVFNLFSVTKAFTNVLVFRAIERGSLALTTKVSAVIPEFSGGLRQHIPFYHLLTHSSGLPTVFTPKPGMYIDRLPEIIEAICANVHCEAEPGERVMYSPMVAHALIGEAVRRLDRRGRSYRQMVEEEIFRPLG